MKERFAPAGPNKLANSESDAGRIAGFWRGLWHGFIAPLMFFVSLFRDDVNIYEVHNNGRWYNFGFVLGLMMSLGGNGGVTKQARSAYKIK